MNEKHYFVYIFVFKIFILLTDFVSMCFLEEEAKLNRLIKDCDLSRLMHDLLGTYVTMEEYFMRESIHKVNYV